ncbi:MAG: hypothetical protein R3F43_22000 [bacterium]
MTRCRRSWASRSSRPSTPTTGCCRRAPASSSPRRRAAATQVPGPLTSTSPPRSSPTPAAEFLTSTATLGILNDVYRSVDGGRRPGPAGLESTTRVRSLVRSGRSRSSSPAAAPATSGDDGGASFQPIALGPPAEDLPGEMPIRPEEFRFLATHPVDRGTAFAVVERFPASFLTFARTMGPDLAGGPGDRTPPTASRSPGQAAR